MVLEAGKNVLGNLRRLRYYSNLAAERNVPSEEHSFLSTLCRSRVPIAARTFQPRNAKD
jgi:hypothetical protein